MWEVEKGKIGLFPSLDAKRIHMLFKIKKDLWLRGMQDFRNPYNMLI
jgi:hypothetical protein